MDQKIVMIDVLDDPPFNITQIFQDLLRENGVQEDLLVRVDGLTSNLVLPSNISIGGFIISGSLHNVGEPKGKEWQDELCRFVRATYHTVPIFGVCFGHQLLAYALGGKIEQAKREVGCTSLFLTQEGAQDVLFSGFTSGSFIPTSHGDVVTALPGEAVCLARNDHSENQAFRIGRSWGIQFHPELQPPLFHQLLGGRYERLIREGKDKEARELQGIIDSLRVCPEAIGVLLRFIHLCQKGGTDD